MYIHRTSHLLSPCNSIVEASHWLSEGYRLYTYVTFTRHLSPCSSMVRVSHWSSESYRLYTYVTFTYHLSPRSSMVRTFHWSSKGYRLYTYVTFTEQLSLLRLCSSIGLGVISLVTRRLPCYPLLFC